MPPKAKHTKMNENLKKFLKKKIQMYNVLATGFWLVKFLGNLYLCPQICWYFVDTILKISYKNNCWF
jgi:hypothetical protein